MVASRMLGLTADQMQNAIGIAASHSCTLGAVTAGPVHTLEIRPLAVDAATRGPYVTDFSVELLEDKSLGRVELPVR